MENESKLLRFDWALKSLVSNTEYNEILEGFLSALLKEDIQIIDVFDKEKKGESNEDQFLKRLDILVKDKNDNSILIGFQNKYEPDYIESLLYDTSKIIVDNIVLIEGFKKIKKVIMVSIQYFNIGYGTDYLYLGSTEFKGVHRIEPLIIKEKIKDETGVWYKNKKNIFPEYYLINISKFRDTVKNDLDEWIYMIKNQKVDPAFKSKNIQKTAKKLNVHSLTEVEKNEYNKFILYLERERSITNNYIDIGQIEIEQTVMEQTETGDERHRIQKQIIASMLNKGMSVEKNIKNYRST